MGDFQGLEPYADVGGTGEVHQVGWGVFGQLVEVPDSLVEAGISITGRVVLRWSRISHGR